MCAYLCIHKSRKPQLVSKAMTNIKSIYFRLTLI